MTALLTRAEPLDLVALLLRPYSNQKLFIIVHFAEKLDQHLLQRSIGLLALRHPVLSRLIVRRRSTPGWSVVAAERPFMRIHECASNGASNIADKWPEQKTCPASAFSADLFSDSVTDSLVFCTDHSVTDAAGAKEAVYQIAADYTKMERGLSPAEPTTNFQERRLSALAKQISNARAIKALYEFGMPAGRWHFARTTRGASPVTRYVIRHSPADFIMNLKTELAALRATVNDALIAAMFSAQTTADPATLNRQLPIQFTIDMRRFLPAAATAPLANLSGSAHVWLQRQRENNFETTLNAASKALTNAKRSLPGLGNALLSESLLRISYPLTEKLVHHAIRRSLATGKANPILSNFGILDENKLKFGDKEVTCAYMAGPSLVPPNFMMAASAFRGKLTISTGLIGVETGNHPLAELPDAMLEILAQLCTQS